MLSSVLNSERAIEVNIAIMRAFVRLRAMLATHADLARRLNELEQKYDEQFRVPIPPTNFRHANCPTMFLPQRV
jgi:hypothetical protein